ncbi:hypothetical protein [Xanthobacter tagetidis]|uniref:hypothetical protein n=1 Tax=Xanthobacter tagetidis TaxID=60216 RepID=UPI0011C37F36|nr:hypothetical protein [Xanthobacter tagetidis]MBB6307142.1 hypothetical protein [Xanthobacter tagetidis]
MAVKGEPTVHLAKMADGGEAYLAGDAEFPPIFARHYVITEAEAKQAAAVLGVEATLGLRVELHIGVAFFVEAMIADMANPHKKVAQVMERLAVPATQVDALSKDGVAEMVASGLISSMAPPPSGSSMGEVLAYPRRVEEVAREYLSQIERPNRGEPPDDLLLDFVYGSTLIAKEFGISLFLPSNARLDSDDLNDGCRFTPFFNWGKHIVHLLVERGFQVIAARRAEPEGAISALGVDRAGERALVAAEGRFQRYQNMSARGLARVLRTVRREMLERPPGPPISFWSRFEP